jgi:hypothetical protein
MRSTRLLLVGLCLFAALVPGCKRQQRTEPAPPSTEPAPPAVAPVAKGPPHPIFGLLGGNANTAPATQPAPQPEPPPPPAPAPAPPPPPERKRPAPEVHVPKTEINPLNLEVTALQMLYQFRITRPQLEELAKLAPFTVGPRPQVREVNASAEYVSTLKHLHDALIDNDDDEIARLSAALEDLRDKENPELDDADITEGARKKVPEFLRSLGARQVASYVTDYADEFPDPREKLVESFEEVRKMPGREWEERRDEVAGQVGWLVAGLDSAAETKINTRVTELLNKVKGLKEEEFKAKRNELERAAADIVGNLGPDDFMRHFVERSLAELLSNPRLAAAVEARLKADQ